MPLQDDLIAAASAFPAPLQPQKDGSLALEALIAERKAFLSKKKLTYKCKLRVDDGARCVTFWEMLLEKGSGVSGSDDMAPGFGFKKESYGLKGKERSGSIEEASSLFGKDFDYTWDFALVRNTVRGMAEAAGYSVNVVLNPKSVCPGAHRRTSDGGGGGGRKSRRSRHRRTDQSRFLMSTGSISSAGANPNTRP